MAPRTVAAMPSASTSRGASPGLPGPRGGEILDEKGSVVILSSIGAGGRLMETVAIIATMVKMESSE